LVRSIPKNPFRGTIEQCNSCDNKFRDPFGKNNEPIRTHDGDKIIQEYVPKCPSCWKKALKNERKRQRMITAISEGQLTTQEAKDYMEGKMSQQTYDNLLRTRTKQKADYAKLQKEVEFIDPKTLKNPQVTDV